MVEFLPRIYKAFRVMYHIIQNASLIPSTTKKVVFTEKVNAKLTTEENISI